jgi:hypothetical protein
VATRALMVEYPTIQGSKDPIERTQIECKQKHKDDDYDGR